MLDKIEVQFSEIFLDDLLDAVSMVRGGGLRLVDASINLTGAECQGPRDRVYGLLALIDWSAHGMERPLPDYSKSAWDLEKELVGELATDDCRGVLKMLRINATSTEMHALVCARLSPPSPLSEPSNVREFDFSRMVASKLSKDGDGTLVCRLEYDQPYDEEAQTCNLSQLLAPLKLMDFGSYDRHDRRPQKSLLTYRLPTRRSRQPPGLPGRLPRLRAHMAGSKPEMLRFTPLLPAPPLWTSSATVSLAK